MSDYVVTAYGVPPVGDGVPHDSKPYQIHNPLPTPDEMRSLLACAIDQTALVDDLIRRVGRLEEQNGVAGNADLDQLFVYHPPTPEQKQAYDLINAAARQFAEVVVRNSPAGKDQDEAVRLIRSACMFANAAIACKPPIKSSAEVSDE